MNLLLAGARAAHFVAAVWLFGELALAALLIRGSPGSSDEAGNLLRRRLPAVARFCIVVGVLSAVAWLAALAGTMSGLPLMQAVAPSVLRQVVSGTLFGRVWMVRASLALLLLLILWPRGVDRSWRLALGTAVAAAYLSTLAWTGHAAAASGPWRPAQLAGDAAHLVAAGAWLGALPALAYLLGSVQSVEEAGLAVRRFSNLAIGAVTVLIVSGIGNSWTLVGSVPALFGTRYGALLLAKLLLFATMLSFAAANRLQLSPRLAAGSRSAMAELRRNTLFEIGAGVLVLIIVGVLGTTIPAAHQSPHWPFAFTLSAPAQASAAIRWGLAATALVATAGIVVAFIAARRRAWRRLAAGLIGLGVAAAASAWMLAVPAYPTTYAMSPVRYTTAAIVEGADLFAAHCAVCHGRDGRGAGPASAGGMRPANLVEHATMHHQGELYWWIAHGRAGTPMPAFAASLDSEAIWSLVQFLRALSDASAWSAVDDDERVASRAIAAPDFSFELQGGGQQMLTTAADRRDTLLVLVALPESLARLSELAADRNAFHARRIEVVAVTSTPDEARAARARAPEAATMIAICSPDVAAAYAMFAATADASEARRHAEFLIDRDGRIRAQWRGAPAHAQARNEQILAAAAKAQGVASAPGSSDEHASHDHAAHEHAH